MELTFVRHTSVDVPPDVFYGRSDVPLKDSFGREAGAVADALRDERFDAVYTSPLSRCVRLADFCGYPDAVRDKRLMEIDFGRWEMKRRDDIDPAELRRWYADWVHIPAGGGESLEAMYRRVASFLDELRRSDFSRVLLFAHGGVIACARVYAGIYPLERAFTDLAPYGGIVRLPID